MLEMRPDCELCGRNLPANSADALICSFECTFCLDCAETTLRGNCANCGGELQPRPSRPDKLIAKYPGSTVRKGPQ